MLELDITSGELKWQSKRLARLNKSEASILAFLLKNINCFSSKDDLLCEGWPGKVVSPNSLAVAIKNIRRALSNATPDFSIETNHGRGYTLHGDANTFKISNNKESISIIENRIHQAGFEIQQVYSAPNSNEEFKPAPTTHNDVLTPYNNEQTTSIKNKLSSTVKHIALALYAIFIMYLALVFRQNTGDLYCYEVAEKTTVCGVFFLNTPQIEKLKALLQGKDGVYFYGQKNNSSEFKVYRDN